MSALLVRLLATVRVAVISGGDWPQFQQQLLGGLSSEADVKQLFLLPTCGTKYYRHESGWTQLYSDDFTTLEREKIVKSLHEVIGSSGVVIDQTWGEQIEDRGSQITFSALGQEAPLDAKKGWDPDFAKRRGMKALLDELIPEFSVRMGGTTSLDVTKPGIDKSYGIRKLSETLDVSIDEMVFIGDAMFPGGNDYPAKDAGVDSIHIRDPDESKRVIEAILACLGAGL